MIHCSWQGGHWILARRLGAAGAKLNADHAAEHMGSSAIVRVVENAGPVRS